MRRAAAATPATSSAPWRVRTRNTKPPKLPMRFMVLRVNAGVMTSTPPAAPRSPRSRGRRTIPTIRSRKRGPSGRVAGVHPPVKHASTCSGVNAVPARWSPTPRWSCPASVSPIVTSSAALGSAARPATTRARSTTVPKRSSRASATAEICGAWVTSNASPSNGPTASTPFTFSKAWSCDPVASPTVNSRSDVRLATLNRASADCERRAPAAVDSTTAPTAPTNSVRTTTRRHRRPISNRANIRTALTSLAPRGRHAHPTTPGPYADHLDGHGSSTRPPGVQEQGGQTPHGPGW